MFRKQNDNKRPLRATRIGEQAFSPSLVRKISSQSLNLIEPKIAQNQIQIPALIRAASFSSRSSLVKTTKMPLPPSLDEIDMLSTVEGLSVESPEEAGSSSALKIGCVTQEGSYHENEDRLAFGFDVSSQVEAFVAILDGHGGEQCAEYISHVVSTHLRETFTTESLWTEGEETVKSMFHALESEFCEIARVEDDTSGSCATVVLVKQNDVLVANIGDCRAVACSPRGVITVLTGDHRADHPDELKRIESAGGSVVNGRVFNLQPSRSFGDLDVKDIAGEDVIIPTPEVQRTTMEKGGFLIVATDGLWDSVSTEDACALAAKCLKANGRDADLTAERLVELALDKRATDDVTVAVLVW